MLLTEGRKKIRERRLAVKSEYRELMSDGSNSTAVVKVLATKYGVSTVTIYSYLRSI